jgi:alpha-D-xyloside xylohydrolase
MRTAMWKLLVFAACLCLLVSCSKGDDDDDGIGRPQPDDDSAASDDTVTDDDAGPDDTGVFTDDDATDDDTTLPEWIEIPAGEMTVRVRTDPYYMEILGPESQTLLATPEPSRAFAINISPMPFLPHAFAAGEQGQDWFYARKVMTYSAFDDDHHLIVNAVDTATGDRNATLELVFRVEDDNHLVFTAAAWGVEPMQYLAGAYKLEADEHFFGLGQQRDAIDSRGKLRNMWLGLGVDLTDQIQNHAPIPFYISSRGYGLFVEDKGHGYFDMGRANPNAYGYKFRPGDGKLATHVFWGPDPMKIIESYTGLTGRAPMNPDYLFGYLHWRNVNNVESEVYDDADNLRAYGIPASSIMVDAPWQSAYSTFEFAACPSGCLWTDPQSMINYVHQKGYAFYLWTAEFVDRVSPVEAPGMYADNSAQFNYAKNNNFLISVLGFVYEIPWWHGDGAMVNFLNPDAYDWYKNLARNVMAMGAQGFKMDGGEYVGADTLGLWTTGAIDLGGFGDPNTAHWHYRWNYHQLFWEVAHEYNGDLAISTVRTAMWGEQTHINYFWPGDLESTWDPDLGLPADIISGLNMGVSGFPYYSSNNGGFSDYDTDDEVLFARWTAAEAFRPVFEGPRGGTHEVWEAYPPEILPIYQKYTTIHTRLFPYMKAYAYESTQTGHPIMRMLPLAFMDDTETYSRNWDYLLGDWLLVEPVYLEGEYTRDVYFPEGRWVNYWNGEVHDGTGHYTEDAPLDSIPVYAKAGAIIPLLDPSVQTLWPTDDPDTVDHLDVEDKLWADIFPYGNSSFTILDGTTFSLSQSGGGFSFSVASAPIERAYSLRAAPSTYDGGEPSGVTGPSGALASFDNYDDWNAAASGWFWDDAAGNLWIRDICTSGTFTVAP